MDEKLRGQLEKMIDKYKIVVQEDGESITWTGFPDKRGVAQIKMHTGEIIEILKER